MKLKNWQVAILLVVMSFIGASLFWGWALMK